MVVQKEAWLTDDCLKGLKSKWAVTSISVQSNSLCSRSHASLAFAFRQNCLNFWKNGRKTQIAFSIKTTFKLNSESILDGFGGLLQHLDWFALPSEGKQRDLIQDPEETQTTICRSFEPAILSSKVIGGHGSILSSFTDEIKDFRKLRDGGFLLRNSERKPASFTGWKGTDSLWATSSSPEALLLREIGNVIDIKRSEHWAQWIWSLFIPRVQ